MKTLIIILTAITLNANCIWYENEYNHTREILERMQFENTPKSIINDQKIRVVRMLENALRICKYKEEHKKLVKKMIKFYEGN